jgi:SAM-dependent methyltransferase
MCEILEHLEAPEEVLCAAMSLLKPGGRFILTCPHDDGIPDPEHLREWGHDNLFHLLAPYSDTISFVHFPPPYFHVWMLAYLNKSVTESRLESSP